MEDLGGTTMAAGLLNAHGVLLNFLLEDPGAVRDCLVRAESRKFRSFCEAVANPTTKTLHRDPYQSMILKFYEILVDLSTLRYILFVPRSQDVGEDHSPECIVKRIRSLLEACRETTCKKEV